MTGRKTYKLTFPTLRNVDYDVKEALVLWDLLSMGRIRNNTSLTILYTVEIIIVCYSAIVVESEWLESFESAHQKDLFILVDTLILSDPRVTSFVQ